PPLRSERHRRRCFRSIRRRWSHRLNRLPQPPLEAALRAVGKPQRAVGKRPPVVALRAVALRAAGLPRPEAARWAAAAVGRSPSAAVEGSTTAGIRHSSPYAQDTARTADREAWVDRVRTVDRVDKVLAYRSSQLTRPCDRRVRLSLALCLTFFLEHPFRPANLGQKLRRLLIPPRYVFRGSRPRRVCAAVRCPLAGWHVRVISQLLQRGRSARAGVGFQSRDCGCSPAYWFVRLAFAQAAP